MYISYSTKAWFSVATQAQALAINIRRRNNVLICRKQKALLINMLVLASQVKTRLNKIYIKKVICILESQWHGYTRLVPSRSQARTAWLARDSRWG